MKYPLFTSYMQPNIYNQSHFLLKGIHTYRCLWVLISSTSLCVWLAKWSARWGINKGRVYNNCIGRLHWMSPKNSVASYVQRDLSNIEYPPLSTDQSFPKKLLSDHLGKPIGGQGNFVTVYFLREKRGRGIFLGHIHSLSPGQSPSLHHIDIGRSDSRIGGSEGLIRGSEDLTGGS